VYLCHSVWKAEKSACDVWIKIGKERGLQHSTWRTLTALGLGVCFFRSCCWEALLLRKKMSYIVITFRKSENICSVSISTVCPHCSYEDSFLHPRT
jgi:hypothetical protein